MREHPIPQDITGYRFHIVGSMTLKQFGELALGAIIAFIIYSTNLFPIIKWPLMFAAFGLGALAAFVPIAERPIDHWIITFFKVLYKPTQFYWKRVKKIPEAFLFVPGKALQPIEQEIDLAPVRRERIKEYLTSTQHDRPTDEFMEGERAQIQEITALFGSVRVHDQNKPATTPQVTQRPDLTNRVRVLRHNQAFDQVFTVFSQKDAQQESLESATSVAELLESATNTSKKSEYLTTEQVAQDIVIPKTQAISIEKNQSEDEVFAGIPTIAPEDQVFIENKTTQSSGGSATGRAVFNTNLPFPDKPTIPNKLVGMVLSANLELVPDAIVEIRRPGGSIERAVKSNALGQFFITTPMANGEYVVQAEKDNMQFPSQSILLTGTPVDPIEVRATA